MKTIELNSSKNPSYKIVDYFELPKTHQLEIINQLENHKDLWGAIPFIINCLKKEGQPQVSPTDGGFHNLLGPGRFFLMLDEENKTEISANHNPLANQLACPTLLAKLIAFISLTKNDEVDITVHGRESWTPWIGCVFTYPEYRGHRLSEELILHAEEYAITEFKAQYTYISTDHIGLYEKYGYDFFTEADTVWGEKTRVLRKSIKK